MRKLNDFLQRQHPSGLVDKDYIAANVLNKDTKFANGMGENILSSLVNHSSVSFADNWAAPLPAYIMDGVDDYVSIPDNANLNFGIGDFTIEWYGKFGNNQTIEINKAAGGGYGIRDNGGYIIWVSANGTGASSYRSITDISSLQSDYHHFVIVFTFGVKTESYIDGVLVNTDTVNIISNNSDSTGDLKLGSIFSVYDDYSYVFLRLYNRALIAAEVTEHWNNGEPEKYQIPFSDSGASQNNLGTNENLSGNTGIVSGTGSSGVAADNWNLYGTAGTSVGSKDGSDYQVITVTSGNFLLRNYNGSDFLNLYYGKKYRLFYNAPSNTTGNNLQVAIKSTGSVTRSLDWTPITGSGYIDFTATGTSSDGLVTFRLDSNGTGAITVSQAKITQIGNVLDLKAENAGAMGWLDASGNGLHAVTSGSPIAPQKLRDYKSGISTTAVEFVNSQKAETLLKGIIVTTASGLPTTISLGTTTLANEILSAQAFTTGDFIAIDKYSASERSLFAKCDAGTVNITMIYEEVA